MRIPVNLAREPFRHDRANLIGSAFVAVLLTGTLVLLISLAVTQRQQSRDTEVALSRVNRQLTSIRNEQAKLDASMRLPGNEEVLDRSILLNTLIKRKAISWTKIFSDLDAVCPPDVRILAIRPTVNAQGGLLLDMQVAGDSQPPIIGFMAKLEGSDAFGSVTPTGFTPPSQTNPFWRYQLTVNYAQKL
jgi:type IV pilus assembly protein PilN